MKKGIDLYMSNEIDAKKKIQMIKDAGFESIFSAIYKSEKISVEKQTDLIRKQGLAIPMIHCSYDGPNLLYFWQEDARGEEIERSYARQIKLTSKLKIKNLVIHLNNEFNPPLSEIGLNRIRRLLKVCERYRINFCIENLYDQAQLEYVFKNIRHRNLKICFDCGHKNFLTPDFAIVEKYHKKITALHLHDNNGITDEHKILGEGNIDLDNLAKTLSLITKNVHLTLEIRRMTSGSLKTISNLHTNLFRNWKQKSIFTEIKCI